MPTKYLNTIKQSAAVRLMIQFIEVLLEGGSRSGKTFIIIRSIVIRAVKYPNSRHLIVRKYHIHVKASIWAQTLPAVMRICFPYLKFESNKQELSITLPNGSQIWCAGSDDKERIEKVLGTEWDTIYLNEVSQFSYDIYETFKTRLNPQKGIKPLFCLDQNPPKKSHWTFQKFHALIDPANRQPLSVEDQARQTYFKMNPDDNKENLNETYLKTLESLSESKKKRFLYGEYGDDTENALWKIDWIISNRLVERPKDLIRIVVAIDPNVTEDKKVNQHTDEAGIITCAEFKMGEDTHYCVIRDDSTAGLSWGKVACDVYKTEGADRIIGEVNQGGDLIEMNLRNYDKSITYKGVRATRGKELRAEPIADLYRRRLIHHVGEFDDLEDELTNWVPGEGRSPNRLDALVWGMAYLSGNIIPEIGMGWA